MTTRLAAPILTLATLAFAWALAGAIARADAPRVAARMASRGVDCYN